MHRHTLAPRIVALALVACGGGASAPPAHPETSGRSAWADALAAPEPFGCTLAPIWAGHVVWITPDGPIAELAAAHQDATAPIPLPPELAASAPGSTRTLVPTRDALCAATLGEPQLIPGYVDETVPSVARRLSGCEGDHAPFALLCPADARVPDDLRWAPFAWSEIAPVDPAGGDALVAHAYAERDELTEAPARAHVDDVPGAIEVDRGRSASITAGDDTIGAAQLGLSWFAPDVDRDTGCPSVELAPGAVYARSAEGAWSRVATGTFFVGVLEDAGHVLALVEDGYSRESEACDGEHACFYVALQTMDGATFARRSRAISQLTSGEIESNSPLRFLDTRHPCMDDDE